MRGTIRRRRKASRLARIVSSVAGAGEDVVGRPLLHRLFGRALERLDRDRHGRRLAPHALEVDLAVVVGELRHPGLRLIEPRLAGVIDSHTHLFLCERAEDELVAAARERRGAADAERRPRRRHATRSRSRPPSVTRSVFATVGCHPTSANEFDDDLAAEIARLAGAREGAGDRRDRDRLLPRHGDAGPSSGARFEAQIEIAAARAAADRDPRPRPRGRDRGDRRRLRDPRRPRRRRGGDPPLLPRPLAGAGRDRARLVLLVLGDRHLPQVRGAARGRRGAARRAASWSRPTPPTWRRSRCAASPTSRPTSSPPREAVAEARGQSYEELERTVEAQRAHALRLVRPRWSGWGRTSSPTPTCSTRSSATRELEPGDVVLEVGPGEGVLTERLAGGAAHVHAVEIDRGPRGGARRVAARPGVELALGRRDEVRLRRSRAGADRDGRQPALRGGDAGAAAHDRGAARRSALDGDGPARDRRPAARRARQPHLRLAERRSPSSPAR